MKSDELKIRALQDLKGYLFAFNDIPGIDTIITKSEKLIDKIKIGEPASFYLTKAEKSTLYFVIENHSFALIDYHGDSFLRHICTYGLDVQYLDIFYRGTSGKRSKDRWTSNTKES